MSALSQATYITQELGRLTDKIEAEEQKKKDQRDQELIDSWKKDKRELIQQLPSFTDAVAPGPAPALSLNHMIVQAASDILPAQASEWCDRLMMHFPMEINTVTKVNAAEGVNIIKRLIQRIKQFPSSTTAREIRLQGIIMGEPLLGCSTRAVLYRGRKGTQPLILKKLDEDQLKGYMAINALAAEQQLEALLLQHRVVPVHLFKHESPLSTQAPPSPEQASAADASSSSSSSSSSSIPSTPSRAVPPRGNALQYTPIKAPEVAAAEAPVVLRDWVSMPHYSTTLAHFAKPLAAGDADTLIQQLMCALEFLHSRQLAHMDVKPDNIFVDQKGGFWLADFDTVRQFSSGSAQQLSAPPPTVVPSTPSFVPSDRKSANGLYPVSAQHDWWMLAMTVADLLTAPLRREMEHGATDSSCAQVREALLELGTQQAVLLGSKLS